MYWKKKIQFSQELLGRLPADLQGLLSSGSGRKVPAPSWLEKTKESVQAETMFRCVLSRIQL